MFVNHVGYQYIVNLSPEFLARHPHVMGEPSKENHFNLPFRFGKATPSVLIVGAGAGTMLPPRFATEAVSWMLLRWTPQSWLWEKASTRNVPMIRLRSRCILRTPGIF